MESDYDCSICFQLMAEPILLDCKHNFCYACIQQTLERNSFNCPLCRAEIPESYYPQVDEAKQQEIYAANPEEFTKIRERLEAEGKWRGSLTSIKFFFGNRHELLDVAEGDHNSHHWTIFCEAVEAAKTSEFIDHVLFRLHPTFRPPEVYV